MQGGLDEYFFVRDANRSGQAALKFFFKGVAFQVKGKKEKSPVLRVDATMPVGTWLQLRVEQQTRPMMHVKHLPVETSSSGFPLAGEGHHPCPGPKKVLLKTQQEAGCDQNFKFGSH